MANRVVISICGEEYTFVADEAAGYMQKVGSYVNEKMSEILEGSKVGRTDAAVLTAVRARRGNYMVFCPSYALLEEIFTIYRENFNDESIECIMQTDFMDEISREAGYSKATLYVYFKNKEELAEVVRKYNII